MGLSHLLLCPAPARKEEGSGGPHYGWNVNNETFQSSNDLDERNGHLDSHPALLDVSENNNPRKVTEKTNISITDSHTLKISTASIQILWDYRKSS